MTGGSTNVAKGINVEVCCNTLPHLQKWEEGLWGGHSQLLEAPLMLQKP